MQSCSWVQLIRVLGLVGLGREFSDSRGLGWVRQLVGWVGSEKMDRIPSSQKCLKLNRIILLSYCFRFKYMKILLFNIENFNL